MLFKLVLAILLGFLIGLERERHNKPAGLKDVVLVIVATMMFTLVNDPQNRVLANLITGIGFLGGGVIIKNHDNVEGVTTAVVLWASVAIGICIGLSRFLEAIVLGMVVYCLLNFSRFLIYRRKS